MEADELSFLQAASRIFWPKPGLANLIRASKRLFATATPRTYATAVHKAAEERGIEIFDQFSISLIRQRKKVAASPAKMELAA